MPEPQPIRITESFEPLLHPYRYKAAYGGRGAGKTWNFARALMVKTMERPRRVLGCREYQNSIRDSVHRVLSDQIQSLGYDDFYEVQKSAIYGANGSEFIFKGIANDPEQIKSMEAVDIVWVAEAQSVSDHSWRVLIPTIRKAESEIWLDFNPQLETDSTYRRFVINPPPDSWVKKVLYSDNPYFPDVLRREMERDYATDPEMANHVWGGQCLTRTEAQVLSGKWRVEAFTADPNTWDGPYFGADFGFSADPSTLVRCWVHNSSLWIDHEAGGKHIANDNLPLMYAEIPGSRQHVIRADSARPETIHHLNQHGFPLVTACQKWKGCVEDGIAHLRGYDSIVIHPRCKETAREALLWRYKTNAAGDVLPVLRDADNHYMDATRYAIEPRIKGRITGDFEISEPTGESVWDR